MFVRSGLLLAVIGILFGVWFSLEIRDWHHKRVRLLDLASKLPGPPALPLIGNALQSAYRQDELLDKLNNVVQRYDSPLRFWLGPKLCVILKEPCDINVILNSSKATYKDSTYRFMEPFLGRGLITGSGPTHRAHRRVIMPMLNAKVLDGYVEYFDRQSRRYADRLEELVDTGEFDIHPFMEHCTVDIIFDTLMGIPGCTEEEFSEQLVQSTHRMSELEHSRMMKVWLQPDWIFARTKYGRHQTTAMRFLHENLIVRKQREHHALERGSVVTKRPRLMLLKQLIANVEKTKLMDDIMLRDRIHTVYAAAQDTTAAVSSFSLLMLGMHPEVQDKVRAELNEILEDRNVTAKSLSELKYLEMVIKETLRLFPIAPVMLRELRSELDLETCTLPSGCSVVMVLHQTHRDPQYWVNPEKFDPDGFTPENSIGRHLYAYVPFSAGFRSCIGQKYAMRCVKTVVANIVRRYRLSCSKSLDELKLKADILIRSVDGYKLSIAKV